MNLKIQLTDGTLVEVNHFLQIMSSYELNQMVKQYHSMHFASFFTFLRFRRSISIHFHDFHSNLNLLVFAVHHL